MRHVYFVTGTDTGAGKTLVAAALLVAAGRRGLRTVGVKPVASGCDRVAGELRNDDALVLARAMSEPLAYELVNPVALEPAIAPHIALAEAGLSLSAADLAARCRPALATAADFAVVEGAGGWRVPLNEHETLADTAAALALPVILVVAMRLGCINHALLSAEAIRHDGLRLAAWVANYADPSMGRPAENLATLKQWLPAPLIGTIPALNSPAPEQAADWLNIELLLENGR